MKQLLQKFLVPAVLTLTATQASAYDFEVDGIYYNKLQNGKSVEVTYRERFDGSQKKYYKGDVIIPNQVIYNGTTYDVTSIGTDAFCMCTSLTSIEIPGSVISIEQDAFSYCWSVTSVEIPNSVAEIGYKAFYGCYGLTSVEISSSVSPIGERAFGSCSDLKEIIVAEENPIFKSYEGILYNKSLTELIECPGGLNEVTIPNSVTSIGNNAFYGCSSLASIELPNSVTSIGDEAFANCGSLTEITSYNLVPPTAVSNSFSGLYNKAILYVPKDAVDNYKNTTPWSNFNNIEIKEISAESIKLNPLKFYVGESVRMSADVLPGNATDKTINWSSDAPEVAAVDADGKVWFNGAGEATVTAECQGLTAAMTFRVEAVEAEELNVFPAEAVGDVGQSFYMLALHTPDNTTDKSVSWESSDPTVAAVDEDGHIELLAQGQTTVTATSGAHTATATITVSDSTVGLVELAGNGVAIKVTDGGIDILNAPEMARVIVSSVDGRVVTAMYAESAELHIPLAPGIYLIKVGDTLTAKVLVK